MTMTVTDLDAFNERQAARRARLNLLSTAIRYVMLFAVGSISFSFVAWRILGERIELEGTFVSLALDILILLALSSRSAASYARRNERQDA